MSQRTERAAVFLVDDELSIIRRFARLIKLVGHADVIRLRAIEKPVVCAAGIAPAETQLSLPDRLPLGLGQRVVGCSLVLGLVHVERAFVRCYLRVRGRRPVGLDVPRRCSAPRRAARTRRSDSRCRSGTPRSLRTALRRPRWAPVAIRPPAQPLARPPPGRCCRSRSARSRRPGARIRPARRLTQRRRRARQTRSRSLPCGRTRARASRSIASRRRGRARRPASPLHRRRHRARRAPRGRQ